MNGWLDRAGAAFRVAQARKLLQMCGEGAHGPLAWVAEVCRWR